MRGLPAAGQIDNGFNFYFFGGFWRWAKKTALGYLYDIMENINPTLNHWALYKRLFIKLNVTPVFLVS
jgi:hypothetical protein